MTPTVPRLRQFFSTPRLRTRSATAVTIAAVSVFAAPLACTHTIEITAPPVDGPSGTPAGGLAPSPDTAPPADAPTPPGLDDDAASTLDWNGEWEWLTPDSTGHTFRAAWAAAPDDLWLVGDHGVVVRWDGKSRARVVYQGPNDVSLKAITGRGPNDVWVAGTNHVAHWDGEGWSYQGHGFGLFDVRALLAIDDTVVALTEDGRLIGEHERAATSGHTAYDDVYDVTPAAAGGVYALRSEGVDWVRYTGRFRSPSSEWVVRFSSPLDAGVWKHGRLFGNSPESFRYFFEHDPDPASRGTYFGVSDTPPPAMARSLSQRVYVERPNRYDVYRGVLVRRTDSEHAFIQIGADTLVYDRQALRSVRLSEERVRGAYRTARGELGLLGVAGFVADAKLDGDERELRVVPLTGRASRGEPEVHETAYAVAADDSAWKAGVRDPAKFRDGVFTRWDETDGFVWRDTPGQMIVVALLPVATNHAWMLLKASVDANAAVLAHWDGTRFDRITPFEPKARLQQLAPEPRGTFFAISSEGELFHADAQGALVPVGRASDERGDPCKVTSAPEWAVHPIGERRAYVVGPRCSVSYFDGASLRTLPPFETEVLDGPRSVHLWSGDERNVFVAHGFNGVFHWNGSRWRRVHRTKELFAGIWGADAEHVWFVENPGGAYHRFDFSPKPEWRLKMWDGKAVRDVGTTPRAGKLTGGSTTGWIFGTDGGREPATLRLRATPRSPRPR
jgi:hypothetical protein